jgi:hypothetical protein
MIWVLLVAGLIGACCVLGFHEGIAAAQRAGGGGEPPFANAVEQRNEMISQLREIKELLKEQNALLRGGNLRVVVTLPDK